MINFITGMLAMVVLSLFAGGLAVSIGSIEFGVIVTIVLIMAYIDFWESLRGKGK